MEAHGCTQQPANYSLPMEPTDRERPKNSCVRALATMKELSRSIHAFVQPDAR